MHKFYKSGWSCKATHLNLFAKNKTVILPASGEHDSKQGEHHKAAPVVLLDSHKDTDSYGSVSYCKHQQADADY